jgi:protoporphyrinogen/coproporphyrinogen III oxidase
MLDVVILGAGLSGLTIAHQLAQENIPFLLLESGSRVGGVIQTEKTDGYLMEAGPNTFPSTAKMMMTLCDELRLKPVATPDMAHNRYVFHQNRLKPVFNSPLGFLISSLLSPLAKIRLLLEPFQNKLQADDETVASFTRRRLGSEVLENLMGPFISGVYAGDPETLSLKAVFPKLAAWEQSAGSLLKGAIQEKRQKRKEAASHSPRPYQLLSFENGLSELPEALLRKLPAGSVRLNSSVESLDRNASGFTVRLSTGESIQCRMLVLATPAYQAASLLQEICPALCDTLASIPYAPLAVIHTAFPKNAVPHALDGFGFLVSLGNRMPFLGSIWASSLFPNRVPEGQVLFSSFVGGGRFPQLKTWDNQTILDETLQSLRKVFHQPHLTPDFQKMIRYDRAIPQYTLGHHNRVCRIEAELQAIPGLFLAGNYLHGVSLNDCVQESRRIAPKIIKMAQEKWQESHC